MKSFVLISILILLYVQSHGQHAYKVTIATDENEQVLAGVVDDLGCAYLAGRVSAKGLDIGNDPYILKVYPNGDTLEKRLFSADTNDYFQTINLLPDGKIILTGHFGIPGSSNYEYLYVCKMDTALNVLFSKAYKLSNGYYFSFGLPHSCIDSDNNIVVAGSASYDVINKVSHTDFIFVKLNQDGDTLLTKIHPFQFSQEVRDIKHIPCTKEYLCLGGNINLHNFGPILLDSTLNIMDFKHYNSDIKIFGSMDWITDTSYLLATMKIVSPYNFTDVKTLIIDTAMNYQKEIQVGKPDTNDYPAIRHSIGYVNDTTIYIGGMVKYVDFWVTIPNVWELYVMDRELNLLGYKEFGDGLANYDLWGVLPTPDLGCILYGTRYSKDNNYEYDIQIVKIRREDIEIETSPITSINKPDRPVLCQGYPNPVINMLHIPLEEYTDLDGYRLQIFNSGGKTKTDRALRGYGNTLQVNVSNLNPGMYIFNITTPENKKLTGKFIKQ